MDAIQSFSVPSLTTLLQSGLILLVYHLGRSVWGLAERLARIEEQLNEARKKLSAIDERCFSVLQRMHGEH